MEAGWYILLLSQALAIADALLFHPKASLISDEVVQHIKQMIDDQLAAKGIRQVGLEAHPDLLVHIFFGVKDELSVEKTSNMPGFFGRQLQAYEYHEGTWTPIKTTRVITHEDHEGILILDFAQPSKKALVGRAVISAVLGDNLEENFKSANKGVAEAFKDYPSAK